MKKIINRKTGDCTMATAEEIADVATLVEAKRLIDPEGNLHLNREDYDLALYALEGLRRGQKARPS